MPDPPRRLKYAAVEPLTHEEAEAALARNDPEELLNVVLGVALHDPDGAWAEEYCLRLVDHAHFSVRGNAVLALGHIARLHRRLDMEQVQPVLSAALADPHEYVRGQASSAIDDVEHFLETHGRRP